MLRPTTRRLLLGLVLLLSVSAASVLAVRGRSQARDEIRATDATAQRRSEARDQLQQPPTSESRVAAERAEPTETETAKKPFSAIQSMLRSSRWNDRQPSGSIEGFIQLDRADPEAQCQVVASGTGRRMQPERLTVAGGGAFTLPGKPGEVRNLRVAASGHGVALIPSVTYGNPATVLADPIQLVGPGSIRVHVVDGNGEPTIGLRVFAKHAGEDDEREALWSGGNGLLRDGARTDKNGRAELRGLAPGAYKLQTRPRDNSKERINFSPFNSTPSPIELVQSPVPADGRTVKITHAKPEILVRVSGLRPEEELGTQHGDLLKRWPWCNATVVDAAQVGSQGGLDDRKALKLRSAGGQVMFSVVPGHRYRIFSHGGPRLPSYIDVDVPSGSGRITVDFKLPSPVEMGTLTLVFPERPLLDPEAPQRSRSPEAFSVVLTSPNNRAFLTTTVLWRTGNKSAPIELPPGNYKISVSGFEFESEHPRTFGQHQETIHVRAGRELKVALESSACAYLELFTSEVPGDHTPAGQVQLDARLIHPNGHREWVVFEGFHKMVGTGHVEGPFLGQQLRTSGLGAGTYRLRVELGDLRVLEQEVQLTAGGTTRVDLQFPAAPPPRKWAQLSRW